MSSDTSHSETPEEGAARKGLGRVFVAFCREKAWDPRVETFASFLAERFEAGPVSVTYRHEAGSLVYYSDRDVSGRLYWRVVLGSASYLLPRPASEERFVEIKGVTGNAAAGENQPCPNQLGRCLPARLAPSADFWVLDDFGALENGRFEPAPASDNSPVAPEPIRPAGGAAAAPAAKLPRLEESKDRVSGAIVTPFPQITVPPMNDWIGMIRMTGGYSTPATPPPLHRKVGIRSTEPARHGDHSKPPAAITPPPPARATPPGKAVPSHRRPARMVAAMAFLLLAWAVWVGLRRGTEEGAAAPNVAPSGTGQPAAAPPVARPVTRPGGGPAASGPFDEDWRTWEREFDQCVAKADLNGALQKLRQTPASNPLQRPGYSDRKLRLHQSAKHANDIQDALSDTGSFQECTGCLSNVAKLGPRDYFPELFASRHADLEELSSLPERVKALLKRRQYAEALQAIESASRKASFPAIGDLREEVLAQQRSGSAEARSPNP